MKEKINQNDIKIRELAKENANLYLQLAKENANLYLQIDIENSIRKCDTCEHSYLGCPKSGVKWIINKDGSKFCSCWEEIEDK